jgi:putative flippase GtrA
MQRLYELARYSVVGVFNAGTYLGLYTVLVLLGMPYVLAAIVAFPLPVALGYWLHEHWTFARSTPTMRRLGAFLLLQGVSFGFSLLLLVILVSGFGVNAILARVFTTLLSPLLVYLGSRAFVFAERDDGPPAPVPDARP